MDSRFRRWALPVCILGFLWFTLINHLRIEWAVNPQYGYGWAVPFLCLYLIWRNRQDPGGAERGWKGEPGSSKSERSHLPSAVFYALLLCLAMAWLPTRLIQEANPEWRLVSWALALEVVGLTLLIWKMEDGRLKLVEPARLPSPIAHRRSPLFAVLFFLIAVPWPTLIEGPLVQFLTHTNAATTVEVVGWFGTPALLRGNIIEVGTGLVGIDDACSGIRSFQATLMISLFLGEWFRLAIRRRLMLIVSGCLLAYLFNVARTSVLVWIASGKGVAAMSAWHDPTGVTILVADFLCLWLLALLLRRTSKVGHARSGTSTIQDPESRIAQSPTPKRAHPVTTTGDVLLPRPARIERGEGYPVDSPQASPPVGEERERISSAIRSAPNSFRTYPALVVLAAWFVVTEIGIEFWYQSHESRLAKTVAWHVEFPRSNPTFQAIPFSDVTRQFLRYDEGLNGVWTEAGTRFQAIFLRWNPGRTAPHLAKSHTPEVCLTAAGHEILSQSEVHPLTVHGLQMPFRSYVIKDGSNPVHVFYCLWEDRADEQTFSSTRLTYANRLAPVLAGRRNSGQRSLEVAFWGMPDSAAAAATLTRELENLIRIEK